VLLVHAPPQLCPFVHHRLPPASMVADSVADPDPGSGAFLTPGSGIGFFRILDLGSQTPIFESLVTIFWVKSSIIL
jgi:hypothetical protein